ncbi:hypothetical protein SH449x_000967 [Pirellulaceae bacterium SH449]
MQASDRETSSSRQASSAWCRAVGLMCCLAFCVLSTGCSNMLNRSRSSLSNLDPDSMKVAGVTNGASRGRMSALTENGEPCVILEVRDGKRHVEKIPLRPGEPMFVGDMVADAQLYKRLGKVKLTIIRPTSSNMPPVRLDVDFDSTGQKVMEGQNYSLRPGDHVLVSRDDTSMFNEWFSPFAKR